MATTDLIGAHLRTDHEAAPSAPTAPLPLAATSLLRSLELKLSFPLPVVRAVTEYETAAVHAKDLAAVAETGDMSDLDADSLAAAEDLMAAARVTLAEAGLEHLVLADDHGKTKDKLPERPRGPHPYPTAVAS